MSQKWLKVCKNILRQYNGKIKKRIGTHFDGRNFFGTIPQECFEQYRFYTLLLEYLFRCSDGIEIVYLGKK